MNSDNLKRQAAYYAVDNYIQSGMRLGLGHGSTVAYALSRLAERLKHEQVRSIQCVPVSEHTAHVARNLGIPLTTLQETPHLDLCIDGADEFDPRLNLIKGLGGALLREKIVAMASAQMVVICDEGKAVERLGTRAPLPVEVLPFGYTTHESWLKSLGCKPNLRRTSNGELFITDSGNYIYDCHFSEGLEDPVWLEKTINNRPGVIENGLFINIASRVVIGTAASGVQMWLRK